MSSLPLSFLEIHPGSNIVYIQSLEGTEEVLIFSPNLVAADRLWRSICAAIRAQKKVPPITVVLPRGGVCSTADLGLQCDSATTRENGKKD